MQTTKWATATSGGRGVGFVRGDPLGQDDGDGDGEVDGDGNDDGPAAEPDAAPGDVPAAPLEPPGGSSPALPVTGGVWRDDRALRLAAVAAAACALAGAAVGIRRRLRREKALRRVRELLHAVQRDAASGQEGCSGEAGAAAAGGSGGGEGSPELEPLGAAQTLRDLLSATPSEQADTAQLVLRSGGVGVVTRRLGDTATDAGLRAALLQALVLLASSPRHESDTLAELAAAGGVPLLTGLLSARATDAEDRRAAARLLWRLSALPGCWAEMAGQGTTQALLRALDTDWVDCPEVGELAARSCARLAADAANLEVMRRAGGRWRLVATAKSEACSAAAREAAQAVLAAMEADAPDPAQPAELPCC